MAEHPKKPFTLAADREQKLENIRDKDNTSLRPNPPRAVKQSHPKLAPFGMLGIKRNLPSPAEQKQGKEPFKQDDLAKTFTPLVRTEADKDRDIDR